MFHWPIRWQDPFGVKSAIPKKMAKLFWGHFCFFFSFSFSQNEVVLIQLSSAKSITQSDRAWDRSAGLQPSPNSVLHKNWHEPKNVQASNNDDDYDNTHEECVPSCLAPASYRDSRFGRGFMAFDQLMRISSLDHGSHDMANRTRLSRLFKRPTAFDKNIDQDGWKGSTSQDTFERFDSPLLDGLLASFTRHIAS